MEWILNATVVGAVLVFVVGAWARLDERSAIRRLERLAEVRKSFEKGDVPGDLTTAMTDLLKKVAEKEAVKPISTKLVNYSALLVSIGFITVAIASELDRLEVEIPYWGVLLLVIGGVLGALGVFLILVVVIIWITQLVRYLFKKNG